jgi:hypothetical protein
MLQTLEAFVTPAAVGLDADQPRDGIPTYREMMADPPSYRDPMIAKEGPIVADAIVGLANAYRSTQLSDGTSKFEMGAPRPRPRLRVRPQP